MLLLTMSEVKHFLLCLDKDRAFCLTLWDVKGRGENGYFCLGRVLDVTLTQHQSDRR